MFNLIYSRTKFWLRLRNNTRKPQIYIVPPLFVQKICVTLAARHSCHTAARRRIICWWGTQRTKHTRWAIPPLVLMVNFHLTVLESYKYWCRKTSAFCFNFVKWFLNFLFKSSFLFDGNISKKSFYFCFLLNNLVIDVNYSVQCTLCICCVC